MRPCAVVLAALVALNAGACRRTQPAVADSATEQAPLDSSTGAAMVDTLTVPAPQNSITSAALADTLKGQAPRELSISSILRSTAANGTPVVVRGICLARAAHAAFGPPPRTRSDWQLGAVSDSTVGIWVTGRRPAGCTPEQGGVGPIALRAVLESDTVTVLATAPRARRYLVVQGGAP